VKLILAYQNKVERKLDGLPRTRFSIYCKHMRKIPLFITKKNPFFRFVPVNRDTSNIGDLVPLGYAIDWRQLTGKAAVYAHFRTIGQTTCDVYQRHRAAFDAIDVAKPMSNETFADEIVSTIVQDLGRNA
jgi:hypothetical protein